MDTPRPADKRSNAYVFVCYSHQDKELVYSEVEWLLAENISVWYDKGISAGSEWTEEIALSIRNCKGFLYFVSPASVATRHCQNEVHYALEHDKPIVAVHLQETILPAGLELSLGRVQALLRYELDAPDYREALVTALATGETARSSLATASPTSSQAQLIEKLFSSIAVFSFDNRTRDAELDVIGEDIAELVADSLARLGLVSGAGFRLVGSRESARFKGQSASYIAEALDVGGILRGTLRKNGDMARLAVELANVRGEQMWRESFDAPLESVIAEPDRLADRVVSACLDTIERTGVELARELPAGSLGPHGLFLKAVTISQVSDPETRRQSRELLGRAAELNPGGMGKALLANRLAFDVLYGASADPRADKARALQLAQESSGSDSALALMHAGLAFSALRQHDRAVALCRISYEKAPRYLPIVLAYAGALFWAGDARTALRLHAEAGALRPKGARVQYSIGLADCYLAVGDVNAAVETAKELVDRGLHDVNLYMTLASALTLLGRTEEAMTAVENARNLVPQLRISQWIEWLHRQIGKKEVAAAVAGGLEVLLKDGCD